MSERVARLRIKLQELEPKIWRCIDMPLSATLDALHEAIQMTMSWTFSHLWEFDIDGRCYGDPSFREFDDEPPGLRLGVVISRGVDRFVYTYDYGDNWRHDVIVEEVRDGDPDSEYPAFVDGARRCPPEDVGGLDGFMDFLEAVLDPAHEQHRDMVRWYGGPFDPIGFDEERARFCMENMVRRGRNQDHPPSTRTTRHSTSASNEPIALTRWPFDSAISIRPSDDPAGSGVGDGSGTTSTGKKDRASSAAGL